ncbi:hypothetical protein SE13_22655, partial [Salmonella enterica subsp. enterica serovar Thompson]
CGVGQGPDQSSLAHLYSEHAGGQMESEHGWPTEDYFIAADSDASGTVNVNLEHGDSGAFTASSYTHPALPTSGGGGRCGNA